MAALSALVGWLLLIALLGLLLAHPVGQLVLASGVVALLVWAFAHRTRPEPEPMVSKPWPPPTPEPEEWDHPGFAADDLVWEYLANVKAARRVRPAAPPATQRVPQPEPSPDAPMTLREQLLEEARRVDEGGGWFHLVQR